MDTFMDKLAQKLTAQEMIKANTAADAEEMKNLKSQIKEYREILDRMQKLVDDSVEKLENAKVDGSEINRLVDESIAKINRIQIETQDNGILQETMIGLKENLTQLEETITAKLNDTEAGMKWLEQSVDEKLISVGEDVHKECVKVYRNVQAVVVEENKKQTESMLAEVNELKALKGKLGTIFGVSVVALIVAVAGIVFQVLVYLHVI